MPTSRLPRFKRAPPTVAIQLTDRDRAIIRLIYRHRFLRSNQIVSLIGGSSQQLLRRLKLLYHHGYLERPRAQLDYYHRGGSRSIAYGLGNKGGLLMKQELGPAFRKASWGEKNRAVGRVFLEHALLVSDIMVTLELACRASGNVRLLHPEDLPLPKKTQKVSQPFRWRVKLPDGKRLGIVPDGVFALESAATDSRTYFFLEADRGTMPVTRRNLAQTSIYRKLLAYEATWSQALHASKFGFDRMRVLMISKSAGRIESIVAACSQLKRGHGLFLFADKSILEHPDGILSAPWQTGNPGQITTLTE